MNQIKLLKLFVLVGYSSYYQIFISCLLYLTSLSFLFTTQIYSLMQNLPNVNVYQIKELNSINESLYNYYDEKFSFNYIRKLVVENKKLDYKYCDKNVYSVEINYNTSPRNWVIDYDIYCDKFKVSLIGTCVLIGTIIGALAFFISNYIGRKKTWIICFFIVFPGIGFLYTNNLYMLYISCVLLGTAQSIFIPLKAIVISENMNSKFRSIVTSLTMTASVVDSLLTYSIYNNFVTWKIPYLVIICVCFILLVLVVFFTVESPRYYMKNENTDLDIDNNDIKSVEYQENTIKMLFSFKYIASFNKKKFEFFELKKETAKDNNNKIEEFDYEEPINKDKNSSKLLYQNENETNDNNSYNGSNFGNLKIPHNQKIDNTDQKLIDNYINLANTSLNSLNRRIIIFCIILASNTIQYFFTLSEIRSYPPNNFYYVFGVSSIPFYFMIGLTSNIIGRKNAMILIYIILILLNLTNIFLNKENLSSFIIYSLKKIAIFIIQAPFYTLQTESFSTKERVSAMTITSICALIISSTSSFIYEYLNKYLEVINICFGIIGLTVLNIFVTDTNKKEEL